jgi:hypothetical protein
MTRMRALLSSKSAKMRDKGTPVSGGSLNLTAARQHRRRQTHGTGRHTTCTSTSAPGVQAVSLREDGAREGRQHEVAERRDVVLGHPPLAELGGVDAAADSHVTLQRPARSGRGDLIQARRQTHTYV